MKEQLQKRKERNEANLRLTNFKKAFTVTRNANGEPLSSQERIAMLPDSFQEDDWREPLLYVYFAVNYYDESCFYEILARVSFFRSQPHLRPIFDKRRDVCFYNLTSTSHTHLDRVRLN